MAPLPHLQVGYVSGVHGLHGEISVRTFDPSSEVLFDVDRVLLKLRDGTEREYGVTDARMGKDLLLSLDGVESREDADPLRGATLFVFREDLEAPSEGEYFQGDLIGLDAFDEAGAPLGKVAELWSTGEVPTLVVRSDQEEVLLPFADDFVVTVDLAQNRIVVRRPEYLE